MVIFELVDTSGEVLGELPDAEATWARGDMITFKGQDLKVVSFGLPTKDQRVPVLVVERVTSG